MASIHDFTAQLRANGVAKSNRFELIFTRLPSALDSFPRDFLKFYCSSVKFAEFDLTTQGTPYGTGPDVKTSYGLLNGGAGKLSTTFMLDAQLGILSMFDVWRLNICNPNHEIGYFEDTYAMIEVYHINPHNEARERGYSFDHVLLNTYTPPAYSYDNDKFQYMDVSFEYRSVSVIPFVNSTVEVWTPTDVNVKDIQANHIPISYVGTTTAGASDSRTLTSVNVKDLQSLQAGNVNIPISYVGTSSFGPTDKHNPVTHNLPDITWANKTAVQRSTLSILSDAINSVSQSLSNLLK